MAQADVLGPVKGHGIRFISKASHLTRIGELFISEDPTISWITTLPSGIQTITFEDPPRTK